MKLSQLFEATSVSALMPTCDTHSGIFETIILNELNWHDRSSLVDILEKNRGRFVHFSRIPKIGINPNKSHDDPHGVYFYPVDWILTGTERVREGQQWGLDWPYFFLADIDRSSPGMVLSKVTWDDVARLAEHNGWKPLLDEYQALPPEEQKKFLPYYTTESPASVMWHLLDKAQKAKRITWSKAFAGLAWIYDDNQAIINNNEPCQLIALNPRVLRNVTMQDNPYQVQATDDRVKYAHKIYTHSVLKIMKELQASYGGKIRWTEDKDKRPYDRNRPKARMRAPAWPEFIFTVGEKVCRLTVSSGWSGMSVYLKYTFRREKGDVLIADDKAFRNNSMQEILAEAKTKIDTVVALQDDLRFTPVISEAEARKVLNQIIDPSKEFKVHVEIENSEKWTSSIRLVAEHVFSAEDENFQTQVQLYITDESMEPSINVRGLSDRAWTPLSISQLGKFDRENISECGPAILDKFDEGLRFARSNFGPSSRNTYGTGLSEDQFKLWLGWFVQNCGLSLGGRLEQAYADEVQAWESERPEDQDYLIYRFSRAMVSRGY
jgi:hypothetical protein